MNSEAPARWPKGPRSWAPALFLAALSAATYRILEPFIEPVVWSVILVFLSWPLHRRLTKALDGRRTLAALLMTLLLTVVLVVPLSGAAVLAQRELAEFFRSVPDWLDQRPSLPAFARNLPGIGAELTARLEAFEDLRELLRLRVVPWLQQFSGSLLGLLGNVGVVAVNLGLCLLTSFCLYRDGATVASQVRTVLRKGLGERMEHYLATAEATVTAVVYGIVLTAIAQATLAGLGYWAAGVDAPILLAVVTLFFALIPFGTPLVWGSISLMLLGHGAHLAGIGLALWGTLVVSWVDNIIRPLVISSATRIPFILVFFGVLGGLAQFGFIGLFVGPVILAIALAVWREWLGRPESADTPQA